MNIGRFWRTVRHLSAGQLGRRALCRGREQAMAVLPGLSRNRLDRAAGLLPLPDPASPCLLDAARLVASLQDAVYGGGASDPASGRIEILGQTFDFGAPDAIDWRLSFAEGEAALKRLTLSYMGFAVPLLAAGGDDAVETTATLVRGFDAQCRFDMPGVLRDGWNPYGASHRLINLLAGLALYHAGGKEPSPEAEWEILEHVRLCAVFVRRKLERDVGYNHLMKNLTALAVYAAACPGDSIASEFIRPLDHDLPELIERCVLADGFHAERSPMYHLLALIDVLALRDCAGAGSGREMLNSTASRMTEALGTMAHPDGDIALFNDSWLGEAPRASALTAAGQAVEGFIRLPDAGYVRLGGGYTGDAVLFDSGPCGPDDNPAHAHGDFLSIEASVGGRRFIVDPGVAAYEAGALRAETRSAGSHNGPHMGGVEPIEAWQSFRIGRRGRAHEIRDAALDGMAPLWCAGRHDGYAHVGCEVRRFVGLWPGAALVVCDVWLGPPDFLEASHFLIPGGWNCGGWAGGAASMVFTCEAGGGPNVRIAAPEGHISSVAKATHHVRFGDGRAAHRLALQPAVFGAHRGAALWCGWGGEAGPPNPDEVKSLIGRLAGAA